MKSAVSVAPAKVGLVFLGHGGDAHGDSRQVDALVVGHRAALDDVADIGVVHLGRDQFDLPSSISRCRRP